MYVRIGENYVVYIQIKVRVKYTSLCMKVYTRVICTFSCTHLYTITFQLTAVRVSMGGVRTCMGSIRRCMASPRAFYADNFRSCDL